MSTTKIARLENWLGLNEAPDGDTGLNMGEAAVMRNFRVTAEGHLQVRPGYAPVCTLSAGNTVRGLWRGLVNGSTHLLAACGGQLWDIDTVNAAAASLGAISDGPTSFFGFGQKLYILTGTEYYCWDGVNAPAPVEGYVPLVVTAAPPEGGGALLERVNLLNGKRRGRYSPDGSAAVFHLPEKAVSEVVSVEGTAITWTADLSAGTVTFESAPPEGVNTIEITWRKGTGQREKVTKMRFAEAYNGDTDARVFLYGDGTHETVYSDLDEYGVPTAEYFPEMNVMAVDSANTPITAMLRHYDRLLVFKSDSAHCAQYSTLTLDTGEVTAAFTCAPVNRAVGNAAPGQALLIANDPRTLFGQGVYQWSLSASGSRDERNARRVSDRAANTLGTFDAAHCLAFDDEERQEYYLVYGSQALIHSYARDVWYYYDHFPARCMVSAAGEIYFGTADGRLMHLSREYRADDGEAIDAYWESGSMDFGKDWLRKYSGGLWIALKPQRQGRVTVTAQTDRLAAHPKRLVVCSYALLYPVDFAHFSFHTGRRPRVVRVPLRARRFTFYKLVLTSCSDKSTATVLGVDVGVGNA